MNGNLTPRFDDKGKDLSIDVNYIRYLNRGNQDFINTENLQQADSSYEFLYQLYSAIRIYNAKAHYVHPLGSLQLSDGAKFSWVENDISFDYYGVEMGSASPDFSKSNHFITMKI